MQDFQQLNTRRLETLKLFELECQAENRLWEQFLNGGRSPEIEAEIMKQKQRCEPAREKHEQARQAMYDAGFIKN
jgi:hypothetical protein